jgi:hypothetical protein
MRRTLAPALGADPAADARRLLLLLLLPLDLLARPPFLQALQRLQAAFAQENCTLQLACCAPRLLDAMVHLLARIAWDFSNCCEPPCHRYRRRLRHRSCQGRGRGRGSDLLLPLLLLMLRLMLLPLLLLPLLTLRPALWTESAAKTSTRCQPQHHLRRTTSAVRPPQHGLRRTTSAGRPPPEELRSTTSEDLRKVVQDHLRRTTSTARPTKEQKGTRAHWGWGL